MSDEQQTGMPLHFRILIALVVGTVVGVAINPGAIELPDEQIPAELKIEAVDGGNGWAVDVKESSGFESVRRKFQSRESLNAALPQDDAGVTESGLPASMISVTERAVHIAEAGGRITIDYTRKHNGQPVSTTVKAGAASELPEHWRKLHAQHGGGWKRTLTAAAKYGGDLFLRLLKMITVPLIVTSLITGVAGLDNTSRFGAMFGRTLAYYGITSMLAITTGLIIVNIVRPGIGAELPGGTEAVLHGGDESLTGILLGLVDNMIPTNPLESLVSSNFLSIITFSIIFAVFLVRTGGENARVLREFFQAAFEVMMRLTMAIISLAPYGVFCFMVYATASQGLAIFGTLAWYMLAVFLALLVHAAITLPLLVKFVAKRSPIEFARAMSPALMTAFSTASSNGTLPLTMTCVEDRAKVSNKVSSFVLPLGATVNMDGTALYEAVAVLFIAQAYRGDLVLADQILVAITALLASVGAAGIPHAGLVMMAIVLQAVNLPLEAQGIIIAVDRVLDMCRTSVNVWSDSCGCAIIAGLDSSANETSQ
ncbi:MAG: dicarboxylate/amino acid:cation symporter [Planctomycetota bacterium]|nr:dicarboxylate/amino acid:cation symporter [Planctomycetota bacterium]MDA0919811.1 dicarboxylate/amino acid:cation symporter [Planctomycetota bacterium]MDA1158506.1 dicarboxylate/amino acid:cation symporter [Planctomycetota bacterium]